jgi:aryl carrier-like protein
VLAREDVPGERRLVAYVVAAGAEQPAAAELRLGLQQTLPEPFIPSAFVFLDAFPLTPHGKIDRRALPAPDGSRQEAGVEFVAPRDPVEEALAAVWAEVLRRDAVGIHDNFFALGGDSIRTIQVVSRSRQRGIVVTARLVFQHQTIAALAAVARLEERRAEPETVPETFPVPSDPGGFTPSDFPVSRLDQEELDELLALLGQSTE